MKTPRLQSTTTCQLIEVMVESSSTVKSPRLSWTTLSVDEGDVRK